MLLILAAFAVQAQPADADRWAWLNIPDAEGPGARFSYDTEVRRTGSRFQAVVRYDATIPGRNGIARVEALVEIDCAARTWRSLRETRGRSRRLTPNATPAPIRRDSRAAVLAQLLCPGTPVLPPS
jgi:hypothetical protein